VTSPGVAAIPGEDRQDLADEVDRAGVGEVAHRDLDRGDLLAIADLDGRDAIAGGADPAVGIDERDPGIARAKAGDRRVVRRGSVGQLRRNRKLGQAIRADQGRPGRVDLESGDRVGQEGDHDEGDGRDHRCVSTPRADRSDHCHIRSSIFLEYRRPRKPNPKGFGVAGRILGWSR
jgi:hypothetical protein